MSYNSKTLRTPTMNGLVLSGSDLMKNMYDATIFFPTQKGRWSDESDFKPYPLTVRMTSFKVPDIETPTYEIGYHGMKIHRPKTEITLDRKIELEFREDSAFDLRRRFSAWQAIISDPVTGGISNNLLYYGKIIVKSLCGTYTAERVVNPYDHGSKQLNGDRGTRKQIFSKRTGEIEEIDGEYNPLAIWTFYNVWVIKVGGVDFSTETAEANKFSVTFGYMDIDFPQYGINSLTGSDDADAENVPDRALDPASEKPASKFRGNDPWENADDVGVDSTIHGFPYYPQP